MFAIDEMSDCLKALSDPTRLKIVSMLSKRGCMLCVNAISHRLAITQSAVSQHLKVLKQAKLVKGERMGYHVHYSVEKERIEQVCNALIEELK